MSIETKKETLAKFVGEKRTPIKTMRHYCVSWCMNNSAHEVKLCPTVDCPLYPYRLGENSFNTKVVPKHQREAAADRLLAYRQARRNRIDIGGTDELD